MTNWLSPWYLSSTDVPGKPRTKPPVPTVVEPVGVIKPSEVNTLPVGCVATSLLPSAEETADNQKSYGKSGGLPTGFPLGANRSAQGFHRLAGILKPFLPGPITSIKSPSFGELGRVRVVNLSINGGIAMVGFHWLAGGADHSPRQGAWVCQGRNRYAPKADKKSQGLIGFHVDDQNKFIRLGLLSPQTETPPRQGVCPSTLQISASRVAPTFPRHRPRRSLFPARLPKMA